MIKKLVLSVFGFLIILGCTTSNPKKPKVLLEKEQMVNLIYDLALLDALRTQNLGRKSYPTASQFVKTKYKIDSLTLAENTKYYAADIKEYKKMYAEAKQKLDDASLKITEDIKSRMPKNSLSRPKVAKQAENGLIK